MRKDEEDLWFRLGYLLERARRSLPASFPPASGTEGASPPRPAGSGSSESGASNPRNPDWVSDLATSGAAALVSRLLGVWDGRRRPGVLGMAKGAAAGAAASVLHQVVRPLLRAGRGGIPSADRALLHQVLRGSGRGLLYASVVHPRLPGPAPLRGAVYGIFEYAASPWGGLTRVLGPVSPHRAIPLISDLLEGTEEDDGLRDHLAFALALALLYSLADEKRGTSSEE